jgi:predicted RNA-binding protein YlxR (DUF448 family)
VSTVVKISVYKQYVKLLRVVALESAFFAEVFFTIAQLKPSRGVFILAPILCAALAELSIKYLFVLVVIDSTRTFLATWA